MNKPPLTRSIGTTERALRALLERTLQSANLGFAQWTALVFTHASGLTADALVQRQLAGHVVARAGEGEASVQSLLAADLLAPDNTGLLTHTPAGASLYQRLSHNIETMTQTLYGDLPAADLETVNRSLQHIAQRANALLDQPAL
jgi:hypothetical protein